MPTDDDRWVEQRTQETNDKYIQRLDKLRSTQPSEIRGSPLTKDQEDQLWKECAGALIRGSIYDRPKKVDQEKSSLLYCGSCFVRLMQSRIAELTSELAAAAERRRKREEENERLFQMLQAQLGNLLQSRTIIHSCTGDARRRETGLGSLDVYSTEEVVELGDEDEGVEED